VIRQAAAAHLLIIEENFWRLSIGRPRAVFIKDIEQHEFSTSARSWFPSHLDDPVRQRPRGTLLGGLQLGGGGLPTPPVGFDIEGELSTPRQRPRIPARSPAET
jgi:hypothetical protein